MYEAKPLNLNAFQVKRPKFYVKRLLSHLNYLYLL